MKQQSYKLKKSVARKPGSPLVVALTGGIASGKTAVSDRFAELGVPVIDTDLIARELVEPGQACLEQIVEHFGTEVLDPSGRLNRSFLRSIIFSDERQRKHLEAILHPAIMELVERRIATISAPYCLVVIPLLAERKSIPTYIDRVLLVDVSEETQLERLMRRDGLDTQQAQAALRSQASRDRRIEISDDIITNSGNLKALDAIVRNLHDKYSEASETKNI